MWNWSNAKEPFDLKLMVLRLMKNIWIPIIAALLGAAIIGGGYYLKNVVWGGETRYELTQTYYVEYGTDPQTGNEYTYINDASWNNWVKTDWFTDRIWEIALKAGMKPEAYGITKQELPGFLTADLPTDLRVPTATVETPDKELTAILGEALEQTFFAFGEEQKEIDAIRLVDETEVSVAERDIRTLRACILGAVLALFFTLLIMLLWFIADDSVRIPETFAFRYGIPMLGAVTEGKDGKKLTVETAENINYVFRDALQSEGQIAVTAVESETDLAAVAALLPEAEYVCIPGILQVPEAAEKLREAKGILLLVQAGAGNGKTVEQVLHNLKVQDCVVTGALLTDADERLLQAYRRPGYRRKR